MFHLLTSNVVAVAYVGDETSTMEWTARRLTVDRMSINISKSTAGGATCGATS